MQQQHERLLRINEIVSNRAKGTIGLLPISLATWKRWAMRGIAPSPVMLGGIATWRESDILRLIDEGLASPNHPSKSHATGGAK
jgi:predicted DNA-binding transcriptional regulator AlpA